jgi:hypothetical protein
LNTNIGDREHGNRCARKEPPYTIIDGVVLYRFQELPILLYIATSERSGDENLLAIWLLFVTKSNSIKWEENARRERTRANSIQEIVTCYTLVNREFLSTK